MLPMESVSHSMWLSLQDHEHEFYTATNDFSQCSQMDLISWWPGNILSLMCDLVFRNLLNLVTLLMFLEPLFQ